MWDGVGGQVDSGEYNLLKSLQREGNEELKVKINNIIPIFNDIRKRKDQKEGSVIFNLYICDSYEFEEKNPILSNEHVRYVWIDPKEFYSKEFMPTLEKNKEQIISFLDRFYNI